MYQVYVQDKNGMPMDPTIRFGKVRRMLDDGRAVVVQRKPFTIRLQYETKKYFTKRYHGGTDPGRGNIGNAVVTDDGDVVYADHITTNNQDVPKHMAKRAEHRRASRRGERECRKRRARKCGTTTDFPNGRMLPKYERPLMLKDIINTEAKFHNRKRPAGWLTPTAKQLLRTHLEQIRQICTLLPITDWTLEVNRFAFMQMEDGSIQGVDFQNGRLREFSDAHAYIDHIQDGKCAVCGAPIGHHHHLIPRSKGGSDTPENLIGLCRHCHEGVHTGILRLDREGLRKKYGHLSVLNQIIPYLIEGLNAMFGEGHVHLVQGNETKLSRTLLGLPKDHHTDAVAIAMMEADAGSVHYDDDVYEVLQFRRRNRARINSQRERTYRLDGNTVAKNRKARYEQDGNALSDWFQKRAAEAGIQTAEAERSRLTVKASRRYYNDPERILPGMTFVCHGKRYVMTGQRTNGRYYRAYGEGKKNFPAAKCRILTHNTGLVYT